ncbi:hypothetical protein [cf. Phormidesmis sp. LEGE 11477]|uniref:hypothetical protein n=1 Tax=cf. Phormidesmis sp. LEGE 11477 TaxID=1828680 RepID=UPI00187F08BB|nr:hypothetical protein [cf. Phormidesmis sp. LEGE 11477]MBE9062267.1 hypothetical protein [cf. Phormidesmis sp. LEGE 11477]
MTVSTLAPLSTAEVQAMAAAWYRQLDVHAKLDEFIPFLAEEGVEMSFPEATVYGFDGFKGWYEKVIGIFFDEVHTVKSVTLEDQNQPSKVKVVVKWEASVWNPPAAKSQRIVLDAYQTWYVVRSPITGKPVIQTYIVDSLDYYPGSAEL